MLKPFWVVYIMGGPAPLVEHTTLESARNQALRLATKEGKTAWILQAVGAYVPTTPQWTDCQDGHCCGGVNG